MTVTVADHGALAKRFETHRPRLRAVAQRMLGPGAESDDAVQQAWIRLSRADTSDVENLGGWLTTVVARVCLDMLRSRKSRREELVGAARFQAVIGSGAQIEPEDEAVLIDSIGRALLVVLDLLSPAERLAFVLHDMFSVPFDEIGLVVGRTPAAAKKLASRARRRVKGVPTAIGTDVTRRRQAADAYLAAARRGDFDALMAVLDPDVVRRTDRIVVPADAATEVRGAPAVAGETFTRLAPCAELAIVNDGVGIVVAPHGRLLAVLELTVTDGRITEIDVIAEPARLRQVRLAVLDAA